MRVTHRLAALSGVLGLSLVLTRCRQGADAVTGTAAAPSAATADTTTNCSAATGNPARVVCLANAFTATLSASEQSAVQLALTQANAVRWSNFPTFFVARNGLQLGALTSTQQAAALAVAQAALSDSGFNRFTGVRAADTYLAAIEPGHFGEGLYYIAFLGTPSTTAPWILQLGGHHYALNLAMNGTATPSPTPFHTGAEPQTFTANGVTNAPLQARKVAMYAMLGSLDATQQTSAKLSQTFDDMLLGPGKDGQFPTQQGVLVSSLSSAQQALVKAAIEAWVKDVPAAEAADILGSYESTGSLARTYVAWAGSTDSTVQGSYIRIDGPRVWMEHVIQGGTTIRTQVHIHSVWRDKAKDYGANFSTLVRTDTLISGTNTAPTITTLRTDPTSGPFSIAANSCGGRYTACLRFAVADVNGSTDAPFKVSVDWGDSTVWTPNSVPASTSLVAPHTYAAAGSYPVTVTVSDVRGAATTQSLTLQVTP